METLGERQVIERLFGPAPARTVMAQEAIVAPEATSEAEDLEAQLEHQESLAMLAQTAQKADEMNQADSGPDFPIDVCPQPSAAWRILHEPRGPVLGQAFPEVKKWPQ